MTALTLMPLGLRLYCTVLAALFGAALASFSGCLVFRALNGTSALRGRSRCDACGHVLSALDLLPVVSWLLLRGRCRYCGAPIGALPLITELLTAVGFALVFDLFGPSAPALGLMIVSLVLFAIVPTFFSAKRGRS